MTKPCDSCGALDHGIYCPLLPRDAPDRDLLMNIWAALRGIGMGAPLDIDYAKELAARLEATFELGRK